MPVFSHLHVHTQFSLLDGASKIDKLYEKALADNMPAVAITDHGNMYGVFSFVAEAWKNKDANGQPKVKPIVGCEFYLVENRHRKTFTKDDKDVRYHQLLLAKNETGYKNLTKLCSLGFLEGVYGKYPRIDKELILQYHEGLIATSCCLAAEIPRTILRKGKDEAEKLLKWWLDLFGEDFYIEIQRHDIQDQITVNEVLLEFAKKYNVPVIASNDSHYVEKDDAFAHDILLCINTGAKISDPKMKDFAEDSVSRAGRFAFANDEFYFKNQSEMNALFHDLPEAIDNTNAIVDKVEALNLYKNIMLPDFPIPDEFRVHKQGEFHYNKDISPYTLDQAEYLKHLTYDGAHKRYGEITEEVKERIDFELSIIRNMGFAGYFLIVSDFINYGKNNGVVVGPGRGSAAGSVVAYCIGITNIDPIKYGLLFERFLNPDRLSMPDIDTDFDDYGRDKVLKYCADRYGKKQVAHIVTYGSMAPKLSIKDVARVMDMDLSRSNYLTKLIPDKPGTTFKDVFETPLSGNKSLESKGYPKEDIDNVAVLRKILVEDAEGLDATVLTQARKLEGTVRNTGVHAAGVIIAPTDISDILPIAVAKDAELYVTQYEGSTIEEAGVIKMDFLGLKTLSIIRDTVNLIKEIHEVSIDIENVSLEDKKTFDLMRKARTIGVFQFESPAMQKHLRNLKPDKFEDLIAMNALYRPGPMDYIESFIARKHGLEEIKYDIPEMAEYLEETYGITVYQEQVMLLSQKLAGFTKGQADKLRKAMGKKKIEELNELKGYFLKGVQEKNHDPEVCEKVWKDWEKFAQYAFNKSHSTCYAFVAFQTAYLKAHYPAEFMATVLSHNLNNLDKMSVFMDECKSLGFKVLGPDINESGVLFSVNKEGNIRFGLSGISGVGELAAQTIVEERKANGFFEDAFDLVKRVKSKHMNKRVLESLSRAGAFDFDKKINRSQYFVPANDGTIGVELLLKYGVAAQEAEQSSQASLFGESSGTGVELGKPKLPDVEELPYFKMLEEERKMVGLFLSSHPLDIYELEIKFTSVVSLFTYQATQKEVLNTKQLLAFYITDVKQLMDKRNKPFLIVNAEDKSGSYTFRLYDDNCVNFAKYMIPQTAVYALIETKENRYTNKDGLPTVFYKTVFHEMGLLQDLAAKKITAIDITVPVQFADDNRLEELITLFEEYKGSYPVVVNFQANKYMLSTQSGKYRLDVNTELVRKLEELDVDVKLKVRS
jgi:DNA polymerase-3 subunit alpha